MNIYIKRGCIIDIDDFGNTIKKWLKNGKPHRTDGPATEYIAGTHKGSYEWALQDIYHRESGPAAVWITDGQISGAEYYLDGKFYPQNKYNPCYTVEIARRKAAKENI